jgi:transcriptional regulator with XRE-family HTH domain
MPGQASPERRRARAQESVHDEVGQELRAQREARGLSLRELARRLNISPSALSQIETGKSRPSVSTLYSIVTELGISLDELFGGRDAPTTSAKRRTPAVQAPEPPADPRQDDTGRVQRGKSRHAIDLQSGVRWERLTAQPDPEADFLYVVYDVGGSSSQNDLFMRHAGREYGLVLSGALEVTVGFDTYEVGPGDSISFDSTIPHRLRNLGPEPATGIWFVVGRSGDDRNRGFAPPPEQS